MRNPLRKPEQLVADMVAELKQLPPVPLRLLLARPLFERLRRVVQVGPPINGRFPIGGLEVRESDLVRTWAIELSDGTVQLPEDELEDG